MKKFWPEILVFIFAMLVACLIAWVAGYNFDKRNPFVAMMLSFAIAISICCAGLSNFFRK